MELTKPPVLDDTGKLIAERLREIRNAIMSGTTGTIYGFHIDSTESDPAECVTYLADAAGMTPAYMDFVNDMFKWGSWRNAFFMPRPCMLKYDGTVDYYLDENDYSKKCDGSPSDIGNTSYGGNAMMEWGRNGRKIWMKILPDANDDTSGSVYIADYQVDDDYHAWPFVNNQGDLVDHFYTPIFNGSYDGAKLRSLSGQAVMKSQTGETEMIRAQANNPSNDLLWNIECFADRLLINMLLVLIGKSLDTQTVFGRGLSESGSENINNGFSTGVHNVKGMFYGTNSGAASTYANSVKVFGMENWWGFQWRRLNGWIMVDGDQKVKLTNGVQDGSTANAYNTTGTGYISIGATPAGSSGGYINISKFTHHGIVPKTASGTSSTYFCDGFWFNNSGVRFALVGGGSGDGVRCGAFFAALNYGVGSASWGFGAALSCKPLAGEGELSA